MPLLCHATPTCEYNGANGRTYFFTNFNIMYFLCDAEESGGEVNCMFGGQALFREQEYGTHGLKSIFCTPTRHSPGDTKINP